MQIQYVLTYVLDESKENVLCLIKESGPAFLIGKINVPGGKIEPKESLQSACSRELFEETGLSIDSKKWINFETYISEEFVLYKFCSKIPKSELDKALAAISACLISGCCSISSRIAAIRPCVVFC